MNGVPIIIYVIINSFLSFNPLHQFLSSEINAGLGRKNKLYLDMDFYN